MINEQARWTDEFIQAMTIFIEPGDSLEWLGDESVEVVMLENVIQMRDEMAAQLTAAQKYMDETTATLAEFNRQRAELDASRNALFARQAEQVDKLIAILDAAKRRIAELEAASAWVHGSGASWTIGGIDGEGYSTLTIDQAVDMIKAAHKRIAELEAGNV
jgi:hypothetical protein